MNIPQWIACLTLAPSLGLAACRDSSAEPAHQPSHASSPATAASGDDARTPVPLTAMMALHQKRDMRDHLRVVQEIAAALAKDDFDQVARSASRIGWSEQQAAKCKHMGAGAPGFATLGESFHRTADHIAEAARRRDRAEVAQALDATLQVCVSCHESYRQDIVATAPAGMDDGCPMAQHK